MAASTVSIVNRALLQIGARAQISNLNEGSTEANAALTLFQPTFQSLARTAYWSCLRAQITLSLLAAAAGTPENPGGTTLPLPPSPWLYSYAYPARCLALRYLVPSLPSTGNGIPVTSATTASGVFIPGNGMIPFNVANSTDAAGNPITIVLTNQSQAQAVYTIDQENPEQWDSLFQAAMVASLGAFFVPALSLNVALMQAAVKSAEGMIAQARVADGNETPVSQDHVPDFIRARSAGAGWGFGWGGQGYCGQQNYGQMCWGY